MTGGGLDLLGSSLLGSKFRLSAIRFRDEEIGQRIAKITLEGFGLT